MSNVCAFTVTPGSQILGFYYLGMARLWRATTAKRVERPRKAHAQKLAMMAPWM